MADGPRNTDSALPDARTLFDGFPVPGYLIQLVDEDFVLADVNAAALASNQALAGVLGKSLSPLYADQPELARAVRRCLDERTTVVLDRPVRRFDLQEARDLRMTIVYIRPDQAAIYVLDLTPARRAEAALVASDERYRRIVETTLEGVWECDLEGRTTFANARMAQMLGTSLEELRASSAFDFTDDEGQAARIRESLAAIALGESGMVERVYRRRDGTRVITSLASCPVVDNGRVVGALGLVRDITGSRQAEAELRTSQERLRQALASARMGAWEWDLGAGKGWWSDSLESIYGPTGDDTGIAGYLRFVHPDDRVDVGETFMRLLGNPVHGSAFEHEHRIVRVDGQQRWVRVNGRVLRDAGRSRLLGTIMDISERKQLEEQLTQSRKMDSIGRLAGGVAHDFNNLLTAILGSVEFAQETAPASMNEDLETIRVAAERAGELTRQLLAFARKQVVQIRPVNLNLVVANLERMLRRIVGEHIEIVTRIAEGLGTVRGDVSQIEQVIINLVVNARDAMPSGGRLTMETANAILDEDYARWNPDVAPGAYAVMSVHDSGVGMDASTQRHIFEPFFTTKSGGTGLGLASCYGIIHQLGGHIAVESAPDKGSTFKVYLPRTTESLEAADARLARPAEGSETVLVVEDDQLVRATVARMVRRRGYSVLVAASGAEALAIGGMHDGRIDLLLTDVVMPAMSGPQLAERFAVLRPSARVLFLSGYTDSEVVRHGVQAGMPFLQKPYSENSLAKKVRDVLDGVAGPRAGAAQPS